MEVLLLIYEGQVDYFDSLDGIRDFIQRHGLFAYTIIEGRILEERG